MTVSFGVRVPPCDLPHNVAAAARVAEEAGFTHVWALDAPLWGGRMLDPYVTLAAAAQETRRLKLGVAVTNAYIRHPVATAGAAQTLAEMSGGRFVLGLATGDSEIRPLGSDGTHTQDGAARRKDLRTTIAALRGLFRGETVTVGGMRVEIGRPRQHVALYVAGTGRKALRLAGELADGVILQVGFRRDLISFAIDQVRAGAAAAGRSLDDIDLVCSTMMSLDPDVTLARDRARPLAAWFYANSPDLVRLAGFEVTQTRPAESVYPDISHAVDHEKAMRAARFVPDDVVDAFCLVGTPESAAERLMEVADVGISQFLVRHYLTYDLPYEPIAQLRRHVMPHIR